jgi:hypothetical protein
MGMEFSDGQMARYIMDNSFSVKKKAMEKINFLLELPFLIDLTIMDSTKMICVGVTEF